MLWRGLIACGPWMTSISLHLVWRGNHWQKSATYRSHSINTVNSLQVNLLLWMSGQQGRHHSVDKPSISWWMLASSTGGSHVQPVVLTWIWLCQLLPKIQVRGGSGVVGEPSRPEDIRCMPQLRKIAGLLVQTWMFLSWWSSSTSGLLVWSKLKSNMSVGLPSTPQSIGFLFAGNLWGLYDESQWTNRRTWHWVWDKRG